MKMHDQTRFGALTLFAFSDMCLLCWSVRRSPGC